MDCNETSRLLDAFADGELDVRSSVDVQDHLRSCPECGRSLDRIRDVKRSLKNAPYYRAPEALSASISKRFGIRPRRFLTLAAFAACMILAGLIGWGLGRAGSARTDSFAAQLLSSHLRSLTVGHLADVISSNKHTVKPWFDGKLDYSPPVTDLTAQGFPLLGGRLEYLNGHRVAALAYGRAKHVISLYVVPTGMLSTSNPPSAEQGYNFLHWTEGGFECWAVSDLNIEELGQFENLERSAP